VPAGGSGHAKAPPVTEPVGGSIEALRGNGSAASPSPLRSYGNRLAPRRVKSSVTPLTSFRWTAPGFPETGSR